MMDRARPVGEVIMRFIHISDLPVVRVIMCLWNYRLPVSIVPVNPHMYVPVFMKSYSHYNKLLLLCSKAL